MKGWNRSNSQIVLRHLLGGQIMPGGDFVLKTTVVSPPIPFSVSFDQLACKEDSAVMSQTP